jgi:hypothetical protein
MAPLPETEGGTIEEIEKCCPHRLLTVADLVASEPT